MEIRGSLQPEFVETPSAKEAVLFANTASFLLNRLQKDSSASYVAGKLKTAEIIEMLKERSKMPPAGPLDLLWIYVLFAALSLKDDIHKFNDDIIAIDASRVQWADEIRRSVMRNRVGTNVVDVQYPELRTDEKTNTPTNIATGSLLVSGLKR